ncbi:hypothetical protein HGRIS_010152 [Hohenbuehelia grisea]|uniref:Fungal-type protein kinase domain-containing protein n=1 Tax=Hohenbuehelia grisea TaxID=104357 RepID=A0ABR3J3T2_9AGAR
MATHKRGASMSAPDPVTPSSKRIKIVELHPDTPLAKKSNVHSTQTQDLTTAQQQERVSKQMKLKDILLDELRHSTFEAEWVREHFCPVLDGQADNVAKALYGHAWNKIDGRFILRAWPTSTTETPYYEPFAKLLNQIVAAFQALNGDEYKQSLFQDVKFCEYTRNMAESVAGEAALKPDLLALLESVVPDAQKGKNAPQVSWYNVLFVGEVKSDWSELIAQAGTYARCLFAATDHRYFIPVVALHHPTSTFRLLFYHRSGVLATTPMKIDTWKGFCEFVATIVGMWRWKDPANAGYVVSQSPHHISLNQREYSIHQVLCRRQAIRGRATTVYAVHRDPVSPSSRRFYPAAPEGKGATWNLLNPFDLPQKKVKLSTQEIQVSEDLPQLFIIKCSYQPRDRPSEDLVFQDVQGFIGVPDIITTYEAEGLQLPDNETPVFWRVIPGAKERPYEPRIHRHLIVKSMGERLSSDLTCVQFVESLLDAMIGHCALFTEGEYLHRDISNGNIVSLTNPSRSEWKVPKILQGIVKKKTCSAILIDGDIAKKLGAAASTADRSGTLPFMSTRLLRLWKRGAAMVHTPLDDLESFVWVLLYDLLGWTPADKKTSDEISWWEDINDENVGQLANNKQAVRDTYSTENPEVEPQFSHALQIFQPLIRAWFVLSVQSAGQHLKLKNPGDITALYNRTYQNYLTIGMEEAAKLPACTIRSLFA